MKTNSILAVMGLLIAFLLLFGCTTSDSDSDLPPAANAPAAPLKEFQMTAKQWEFVPSTITVTKGDLVKLSITSVDVDHGISIPDFGVNETLVAGQTMVVEFLADKKGTFSFTCNVYCGEGHGIMIGELIVN